MMAGVWSDLVYAVRRIRLSPGFSLTVILTIAVGVAGTTYVFSEINALYLRPLSLTRPDRLVTVVHADERARASSFFMLPGYEVLRGETRAFTGWTASTGSVFGLGGQGTPPRAITGRFVDAGYFRVLGTTPEIGRFFTDAESAAGMEPVVVLSHDLWRRRFNADPGVVGTTVRLNGRPAVVVGVARRRFNGVSRAVSEELWIPLGAYASFNPSVVPGMANPAVVEVVGRLANAVSRPQADAALAARVGELASADPMAQQARALRVEPLSGLPFAGRGEGGAGRKVMQLGTALLVLLIASINVAGMLLVRATTRRKEIAVRIALGATRARVIQQLAMESLVLFLLGGSAGIWLAVIAGEVRPASLSSSTPLRLVLDYGLDGRVLAFSLALSLLTSAVFGLIPAFQGSRTELVPALKETPEPMRRHSRLRDAFLVGQHAASVLLLLAAGTLLQALQRAQHADPGFRVEGVAVATLDVGLLGYDQARTAEFYREAMERLGRIPGGSTALASAAPFGNTESTLSVTPADGGGGRGALVVQATRVSPAYFNTLGIAILRGRGFTSAEGGEGAGSVVIGAEVARRLWGEGDPVGRRLVVAGRGLEVVGVARDVQARQLGGRAPLQLYTPLGRDLAGELAILVRAPGGAAAGLDAIRRVVEDLDPDLPQTRAAALEDLAGETLSARRNAAARTVVFGSIGLLLAGIGLYGAIAYQVARRTHEIGVRMALGAQVGEVKGMIFRRGMVLALFGIALGLALYLPAAGVLVNRVYGARPVGWAPLLIAPAALLLVAALASYLPARRAALLNPAEALRVQ